MFPRSGAEASQPSAVSVVTAAAARVGASVGTLSRRVVPWRKTEINGAMGRHREGAVGSSPNSLLLPCLLLKAIPDSALLAR